jgi:hypothetical protein
MATPPVAKPKCTMLLTFEDRRKLAAWVLNSDTGTTVLAADTGFRLDAGTPARTLLRLDETMYAPLPVVTPTQSTACELQHNTLVLFPPLGASIDISLLLANVDITIRSVAVHDSVPQDGTTLELVYMPDALPYDGAAGNTLTVDMGFNDNGYFTPVTGLHAFPLVTLTGSAVTFSTWGVVKIKFYAKFCSYGAWVQQL